MLFSMTFFMILRHKMILVVVSRERKSINFYEKNFELTKINTFDNVYLQ